MPDAVRGKDTLGYLGTPAVHPANVITQERDPTAQDDNVPIGTVWVNTLLDRVLILTNIVPATGATWVLVT